MMETANQRNPDPMITIAVQEPSAQELRPDSASDIAFGVLFNKLTIIPITPNTSSISLAIMATIALVFALQWAQRFFIPLVFGIIISYTLTPVVTWLERRRIPRVIATHANLDPAPHPVPR
jgi:AI-2E family transporter